VTDWLMACPSVGLTVCLSVFCRAQSDSDAAKLRDKQVREALHELMDLFTRRMTDVTESVAAERQQRRANMDDLATKLDGHIRQVVDRIKSDRRSAGVEARSVDGRVHAVEAANDQLREMLRSSDAERVKLADIVRIEVQARMSSEEAVRTAIGTSRHRACPFLAVLSCDCSQHHCRQRSLVLMLLLPLLWWFQSRMGVIAVRGGRVDVCTTSMSQAKGLLLHYVDSISSAIDNVREEASNAFQRQREALQSLVRAVSRHCGCTVVARPLLSLCRAWLQSGDLKQQVESLTQYVLSLVTACMCCRRCAARGDRRRVLPVDVCRQVERVTTSRAETASVSPRQRLASPAPSVVPDSVQRDLQRHDESIAALDDRLKLCVSTSLRRAAHTHSSLACCVSDSQLCGGPVRHLCCHPVGCR
jgi:hypothetical protein